MIIDDEFRNLIPPLTPDELAQLEANLVEDGCRDPLVVWHEHGILLDGHHRFEICTRLGIPYETREQAYPSRDEAKLWLVVNQFGRRNLTNGQRCDLALVAKPLLAAQAEERMRAGVADPRPISDEGRTDVALAKLAGVGKDTLRKYETIKTRAAPEIKARVDRGETTINAEHKKIIKNSRRDEKAKAFMEHTAASRATERDPEWCDLRVMSCVDLLSSASAVDVIITDPPYTKDAIPLYGDLAAAAAPVLGESGVLAVMCGQSYIPEILDAMTPHLPYRWMMAYMTPGGQSVQLWQRKVNTFWKPILLFGAVGQWIGDVVSSDVNDNDKRFHEWGQSESGMAGLVERLSSPGQRVCDPFLGAGTTAVVCAQLGRRFIGGDVAAECVERAWARVSACGKSGPAGEMTA